MEEDTETSEALGLCTPKAVEKKQKKTNRGSFFKRAPPGRPIQNQYPGPPVALPQRLPFPAAEVARESLALLHAEHPPPS